LIESVGSEESPALEYVDAIVVSGAMLALAEIDALAEAPLESDASGTGTLVAPGAGLGIGTASLDEKPCDGATVGAAVGPPGGSGPPGALVPEPPPPPPQAARMAMPKTAPPRSAEIRFMHHPSGGGMRS
jgi:hypothetical protein